MIPLKSSIQLISQGSVLLSSTRQTLRSVILGQSPLVGSMPAASASTLTSLRSVLSGSISRSSANLALPLRTVQHPLLSLRQQRAWLSTELPKDSNKDGQNSSGGSSSTSSSSSSAASSAPTTESENTDAGNSNTIDDKSDAKESKQTTRQSKTAKQKGAESLLPDDWRKWIENELSPESAAESSAEKKQKKEKRKKKAEAKQDDEVSDDDEDEDEPEEEPEETDSKGKKDQTKKKQKGVFAWLTSAFNQLPREVKWLIAAATGLCLIPPLLKATPGDTEITWKMFSTELLERDDLDHLEVVGSEYVRVFMADNPRRAAYFFNIGDRGSFDLKLAAAQNDLGLRVVDRVPVVYSSEMNTGSGFITLSLFMLTFASGLLIMGQAAKSMNATMMGRILGGQSKLISPEKVKVKFADVAGCDEAKTEIMEFVDFLKNPEKFRKLGARIPKGALLCGPPGTGKTLLAKATAGEAGVPFFSISGSEFVEVYVGVGPSRVRKLFSAARQKAPCIVFIDEIDAIGQKRDSKHNPNMERENTLNQLLVEMDGFRQGSEVIVLAATNRDDTLDPALLRPGRFDRRVSVSLPEIKGRKDILMIHMKNLKLKGDHLEWAKHIAALTPGMSGAELANICNEAALIAARTQEELIDLPHLEAAIERVIAGLEKKSRLLSAVEKRTVAYHEAGHAILGWYLEHADPLLKVSIVPRGQALGYAQLQAKERNLLNQEQILDRVCVSLGGRAAEQLVFGEITSGASDDLSRVTQLAYGCVTRYGFGSEVGHVSFPDESPYAVEKPYSDHTSRMIDLQVRDYVNQAYQRTLQILEENRDALEKVAQLLLQREVISRSDMETLLGKRPWNQTTSYEELSGEA